MVIYINLYSFDFYKKIIYILITRTYGFLKMICICFYLDKWDVSVVLYFVLIIYVIVIWYLI